MLSTGPRLLCREEWEGSNDDGRGFKHVPLRALLSCLPLLLQKSELVQPTIAKLDRPVGTGNFTMVAFFRSRFGYNGLRTVMAVARMMLLSQLRGRVCVCVCVCVMGRGRCFS